MGKGRARLVGQALRPGAGVWRGGRGVTLKFVCGCSAGMVARFVGVYAVVTGCGGWPWGRGWGGRVDSSAVWREVPAVLGWGVLEVGFASNACETARAVALATRQPRHGRFRCSCNALGLGALQLLPSAILR